MKYFVFITLLVLILNCSGENNSLGPSGTSDFAIYFLKDPSIRTGQVVDQELSKIELETDPWLSSEDIDFYDFTTHLIYLKTDKSDFFEYYDDQPLFDPVTIDKPFVVVAGGERCYLGSLHSWLLSSFPVGPYMHEGDVWGYAKDVMHITKDLTSDQDIRSDDRIKNALTQLNLFHGGLSVELDAVEIIENADTSTVQFSFTITNHDQDNLYIVDPDLVYDLVSSELFHFYTNGVTFRHETTHFLVRYNRPVIPDLYNGWPPVYRSLPPDWFTRIPSKKSLQRTVTLKGYPKFPQGEYTCYFNYSCQADIPRDHRILSDGRYWLGGIFSNEIQMIVDYRE